jgi:flagellar hook-associated protein 1 FlgK
MSGLASIMDTSVGAMFAAQVALQTVGHNIANANTPGFSRQDVLLSARRPNKFPYGVVGLGVQVEGIRRLTDEHLVARLRTQSARLGSYTQLDGTLQQIESVLGSLDNDRIGDAVNAFFKAWSDLATAPFEDSNKWTVLNSAQSMVAEFHSIDGSLDELARSQRMAVESELADLNDMLQQVAELNTQIVSASAGGPEFNDLLDRQELLLSQIAEQAEVQVRRRADGSADVIMGGRSLVVRDRAELLQLSWQEEEDGLHMSVLTQSSRAQVQMSEGSIQGLITSVETHVQGTQAKLDALAVLLMDRVNQLHVQGRSGTSAGLPFFTGDSASSMEVTASIAADATRIVTSRSGIQGDNDLALAIADLAHQPLDGEDGPVLMDSYRALLSDLASASHRYNFLVENQENVRMAVESRLESTRGVSLDEEGANLVRYQNAYEAAARVVVTVQEMFDTLLKMV